MPRRRAKRRSRSSAQFLSANFPALFRKALPHLIVVGIFIAIGAASWSAASKSGYFNIKKMEIVGVNIPTTLKNSKVTRNFLGKNIFDVDITHLQKSVKTDYPEVLRVRAWRVLPCVLRLEVKGRTPAAQVNVGGLYYPVDREGVVISDVRDMATPNMPIIIGLDRRISSYVGVEFKSGQLKLALILLNELETSDFLSEHTLMMIDVTRPKNTSFYIEDGLEVRIGDEDFKVRLAKLKDLLAQAGFDKSGIKYIDLRFSDIIIGPK